MFASYSLAFWYGSKLVQDKETDGGTVLNVFFAILIGAFALGNAGPSFTTLGTALGAATKVFATIEKKPEIDSMSDQGNTLENFTSNIIFENIDFRTLFSRVYQLIH